MKKVKRLLTSTLLVAVTAVGLLFLNSSCILAAPSNIISGAEGSGTESDPLIVDNFAELKEALQYNGTLYIQVDEFTTNGSDSETSYYSLQDNDFIDNEPVISLIGIKYLELNTRVDIRNAKPSRAVATLIAVRGSLTLTGSGTLCGGLSSNTSVNSVLYIESTGKLTCDSGTITVKNMIAASANAVTVNAGHCRVNGGSLEGYTDPLYYDNNSSYAYFGNALLANGGTVDLYSGSYEVNDGGNSDYSLCIRNNASVKIEGGTFNGILSTNNNNIETYLQDGYSFYQFGTGEKVLANTKEIEGKKLFVRNYDPIISSVNVNVTVPIEGQHPATPVVETQGLRISTYNWYDPSDEINDSAVFEAGKKYKLHVIVMPEDGYSFKGEYSFAGHVTFNSDIPGTVIVENEYAINYYYEFTAVQTSVRTISFNANGGTIDVVTADTGSNGKLASLPVPARPSYHFDGWYTKEAGGVKVDTNFIFTSNMTVYAHWKDLVYYTVAFNTNGGSPIADKQVEVDTKVDKPADPTRSSDKDYDYTFAGWYSDSGLTTAFDFDTLINANTAIYAKWGKKAKTGNGGSSSGDVNPSPTPSGTSDPKTDSGNQPDTDSGTGTTLTTVTAPGKVTLSKPKNNKKKTATISWKKIKADGYEVQIALKKNFKKGKQTKTTTKTSLKFKKLKKGKTYYVRVRAYNLDGDKKVYSKKWSAVKKIKIKK